MSEEAPRNAGVAHRELQTLCSLLGKIPPARRGAAMQSVISFSPQSAFGSELLIGCLRAAFADVWESAHREPVPIRNLRSLLHPPIPIRTVLEFARLNIPTDAAELEDVLSCLLTFLAAEVKRLGGEKQLSLFEASEADSVLIRRLALLLRHGTDRIALDVDKGGWASLDDVVSCLNDRSLSTGFWLPVTRHQLEHRLCQTPFVERFECLKDQMRARYGHSLPHVVVGIESDPPMRLFHVSCVWHLHEIAKVGLLPGARNFVHLTSCPEYARSLSETIPFPIKLVVESVLAATRGIGFRQATAHVWLAPCIPAEFIHCRNKPLRELVQKGGAT